MMKSKTDHYAIVIGINQYAELPALQEPRNDALKILNWLKSAEGCNLPDENIQALLSPLSSEQSLRTDSPQKWSIDRAMREFGVQSGAHIGQRLTFYFAGYSLLDSNGELLLLTSDWTVDTPENCLWLRAYWEFFEEAAPFEEIVFILDTQRLEYTMTHQSFGIPDLARSRKWAPDREVVVFSLDHHPLADDGGESRGRLTQAFVEGFEKPALNSEGQITAASLGHYVVDRVAALLEEAGTSDQTGVKMTVDLSQEIIFGQAPDDQANGMLVVELPHWTAQIFVFDHQYREISDLGPIEEDPPGSGAFKAKISLPKGVYKVDAHLEGQVESQFILLHAGKTAHVKQDSWKSLSFKSAAPLADASSSRENQMKQAEKKSLEITWLDAPGGDSRLFLFLRTQDPDKHPDYYRGLKLLDHNGELITDFSYGIKRNSRGGWMAFNADLPAGYYILRRGRRGVWVRQQPVYLCAGWETHVFLQARDNFPSLSTMALDMSPKGTGFHADDTATAAAEAVLCSLGQSGHEPGIATRGRLQILLDQQNKNPWLGILASYALLRADLSGDPESAALLKDVLAYLQETIGDHPDVRALHLNADEPAMEPFWNPPILRAGLARVQAHAIQHASTIPLDCLCDVVLDNIIVNTPWTAWRHLDRKPLSAEGDHVKGIKPYKKTPTAYQAPSIAQTLAQSAPPELPVFEYAVSMPAEEPDLESTVEAPIAAAAPAIQANIVQQVQAITAKTNSESWPDSIQIVSSGDVDNLLSDIHAQEVSKASGIPLARAERGLDSLRQRKAGLTASGYDEVQISESLSADEQVVYNYAVQMQATAYQQMDAFSQYEKDKDRLEMAAAEDESFSKSATLDPLAASPKATIEDTALNLRTEADRIFLSGEQTGDLEAVQTIADRLYALADALLQSADYTVLIDQDGYISYSNGAFLGLITPEVQLIGDPGKAWESLTNEIDRQREANRRMWEESIRALQPGEATMVDPLRGTEEPLWTFKRTAVKDESGHEKATLYAFRRQSAPTLEPHVLRDVSAITPELTFNSSMFAYSSGESAHRYLQKIEDIVLKLEEIVLTQ